MNRQPKGQHAALPPLEKGGPATPFQALLNMLQADPANPNGTNKPQINVARHSLDKLSRRISQNHTDSDAIMQLLSDLELVETVLVGSILSPKDLGETDLTFTSDPTLFDSEIGRLLMEPIEEYFKRDYKINNQLDMMLRRILFRKGAHIFVIIPENNLDSLINGHRKVSMEQFQSVYQSYKRSQPLGLLGHPDPNKANISMENYDVSSDGANFLQHGGFKSTTVTVSDNIGLLRAPKLAEHIRKLRISQKLSKYSASMESEAHKTHKFTSQEIAALYKRGGYSEQTQVITAPEFMDRKAVGHPLAIEWPVEALMPFFPAGQPHNHKGYMGILDINGNPVTKEANRDYYGEMQGAFQKSSGGEDSNSELLRMTREAMGHGGTGTTNDFDLNQIQDTYTSIMMNDFNNRLRNGMYDEDMEVGMTQEVKEMMLYRNWKGKATQLVFIPVELVTYIAFEYDDRGIGETLLQRSKMVATMRSTLLMADVVGGMRNAVGRKRVNIVLDPDDVDPDASVTQTQSLIMESAHRQFPLAAPDPTQALDYLVRSGYDFAVDANGNEAYSAMKVEYDDWQTNVQAGNPDLQDRLRRMHIASMGIPPEKVDPMSNPDFATSIIQNDLVMSRRVKEKQKVFCGHLSKFFQTFTRYSSILRDRLNVIIQKNSAALTGVYKEMSIEEVINEFIDSIEVGLPAPDTTQHEKQAEAFDSYNRLLDMGLEAYLTEGLIPDDFTGVPGLAEKALAVVKAGFQRQWLSSNNVLPELNVLTEMEGDKPAFSMLDYDNIRTKSVSHAILEWAGQHLKNQKELATRFNSVVEGSDDTAGDYGSDSTNDETSSSGGDDTFADTGGGFGGDMDFGGTDTGESSGDDLIPDMNENSFDTVPGDNVGEAETSDATANPVEAAATDNEAAGAQPGSTEEEEEEEPK